MVTSAIDIPESKITEFCQRNHIARLSLFGSVLREDFGPKSDVDLIVEFDSDRMPGLAFFGMQAELASIFGREVDLHTPAEFSRYLKHVLEEAQPIYVAS
jgi:predicted nucleotidyltransferase